MIALDNGFQEAVGIVLDAEATAGRLCRAFGFGIISHGECDPSMLDLLGVDPGWRSVEILVGDAGQERGYIRLIAFPGQATGVMRDGAQPWDSGGQFDINVRALIPIELLHETMTREGFCAFGPLVGWDFGTLAVKESIYRDADGLAIAIIERLAPPLEGFEQVAGPASYVFNATQVVPDFEAATGLFRDVIGWPPYQESRWTHADGRNCLGLPLDSARTKELRAGIYHRSGSNEGSVELLNFAGETLDFSGASPPDRGWASLRFAMAEPEPFLKRAQAGGCRIVALREARIEPYGKVKAGAAITPWGARLEVFQPL